MMNLSEGKQKIKTRKSSCRKPQEVYRTLALTLVRGYLPWRGWGAGGRTYLGWGVPTLARGVSTLAGGYLPWSGGYPPWLGGIYHVWGTYLGWGVPTLAGGAYLGQEGTYLGQGVVPTLARGGGVPTLARMGYPPPPPMGVNRQTPVKT